MKVKFQGQGHRIRVWAMLFFMIVSTMVSPMQAMADDETKSTIYDYYSQNNVPFYSKNTVAGCNSSSSGSSDSGSGGGGAGGSWRDPSTPSGANVQKVINALGDMGFSGAQIAGFIGNLAQETSTIDPSSGDDGANGAGGGGIVQWSPTRLRKLANDASIWTIDYQVKLIVYELSNDYKGALSQPTKTVGVAFQGGTSPPTDPVITLTDPRKAAWAWDNFYEVGTNPNDKRGDNAVAFWDDNKFSYNGTKLQDIKGDTSKLGAASAGGSDSSSSSGSSSCTSSNTSGGGAAGSVDDPQSIVTHFLSQCGKSATMPDMSKEPVGKYAKVAPVSCGGTSFMGVAGTECVALSVDYWGFNPHGNGQDIVGNLIAQGKAKASSGPVAGGVFSVAGGTMFNGWQTSPLYGHTGIVIAVNPGVSIITLENGSNTMFSEVVSWADATQKGVSYTDKKP